MSADTWKRLGAYSFARGPYDGRVVWVRTRNGLEFRAYYDDPSIIIGKYSDVSAEHRRGGSWRGIDGQGISEDDPPEMWKSFTDVDLDQNPKS